MQEFTQLVEILENYVEVEDISPKDYFRTDLEMSSFDTMCLVTDVKATFGVSLKATDFVDYKTVGEMEADLREAYRKCGEEADCKVHYVGKAFTNVYENHSNINIYASDERHQNNYGSYLSAVIHVKGIFNISLEGCSEYCGLDESKCKTLLSIANKN